MRVPPAPATADTLIGQRNWELPPGSPYTRQRIEEAGELAATLDGCAARLPKFAAENEQSIRLWKIRNAGPIRAAEEHPVTGEKMRRLRTEPDAVAPDRERSGIQLFCDSILFRFLGKKFDTAGFETPEATWGRMVRALNAGKVDEALESVSPDSREEFRRMIAGLDLGSAKNLNNTLGTLHGVAFSGGSKTGEESARGTLVKPGKAPSEVGFVKMLGRWFISRF